MELCFHFSWFEWISTTVSAWTTRKLFFFSCCEENLAAGNCRSSRSRKHPQLNDFLHMPRVTISSPFNRCLWPVRQWPAWRCGDASRVRSSTLRREIDVSPIFGERKKQMGLVWFPMGQALPFFSGCSRLFYSAGNSFGRIFTRESAKCDAFVKATNVTNEGFEPTLGVILKLYCNDSHHFTPDRERKDLSSCQNYAKTPGRLLVPWWIVSALSLSEGCFLLMSQETGCLWALFNV